MNGLFVAGTDTDAGKTLITAALVRGMRMFGIDAVPMKVVQTGGGYTRDGAPMSEDFDVYCRAASFTQDPEERKDMVPYSFRAPCSPHLAARMEGRTCEIAPIMAALRRLGARHELVIAEGVGGINVPLSESLTSLDLINAMGFPLVLVVRNTLGCINHALNAVEILRSRSVAIKGAIMTEISASSPEETFILADNPRIIRGLGRIPILGVIPFIPPGDDPRRFWETLDGYTKGIARSLLKGDGDESGG